MSPNPSPTRWLKRERRIVNGVLVDVPVGFASPLEMRKCACGTFVTAVAPYTEEGITQAVQNHQQSAAHRTWSEAGGMDT